MAGGDPSVIHLTAPMALAVGGVVTAAWVVTATSPDAFMTLMGAGLTIGAAGLSLFFALNVTMMAAMMLPSAVPMILTYHGMTRLKAGELENDRRGHLEGD